MSLDVRKKAMSEEITKKVTLTYFEKYYLSVSK
jgi:hypothetical protein